MARVAREIGQSWQRAGALGGRSRIRQCATGERPSLASPPAVQPPSGDAGRPPSERRPSRSTAMSLRRRVIRSLLATALLAGVVTVVGGSTAQADPLPTDFQEQI